MDENGKAYTDPDTIWRRSGEYYEGSFSYENPRLRRGAGVGTEGEVELICEEEVKNALKKMENGKEVGPDKSPAGAWKSLGGEGIRLVTVLLTVTVEEAIPREWIRDNLRVSICKEKGDEQNCANSGGIIKLTTHHEVAGKSV